MSVGKVKLTCDSPISNKACLTINGEIIPFIEANIKLKAGEFVEITARTRADLIDIEALQNNTTLEVVTLAKDRTNQKELNQISNANLLDLLEHRLGSKVPDRLASELLHWRNNYVDQLTEEE